MDSTIRTRPRRAGRILLLILFVIVLLCALWTWIALSWSYSDGERAGILQKFSSKGWICKTYEGELALYVVGGVAPQIWDFSTRDPKLAEQLRQAVGKQVRVHYSEHRGLPTQCFADTPYFAESFTVVDAATRYQPMTTLADFEATSISGAAVPLQQFVGSVVLVVNTASRCGFTPQYEGLQQLYERYQGRGFTVLGFPCNQFGAQEPGSESEIQSFCSTRYSITFPMFAKLEVNGAAAHPLYRWLTTEAPGVLGTKAIKWNFTKFLLDRSGAVRDRYAPQTAPSEIASAIEALL